MDGSDVRPWKRLEGTVVGNFSVLVPVILSAADFVESRGKNKVRKRKEKKEERNEGGTEGIRIKDELTELRISRL